MTFDELMDAVKRDGDHFKTNPGEDWRQGRTLFGGLSAALCLSACQRFVPDLPPLRAGQVAFIGPSVGEGTLVPTLLRRGKSVTFMGCDLIADGAVATRAIFTFGGARETSFQAQATKAPDITAPADTPSLWGKIKPAFTQHLDQRLALGARPGSGATTGDMGVWVRHIPDARPSSAALLALGDALPPATLTRANAATIISTMTWGFDLFDPERHDGTGWYLVRSTDDGVGAGYAGQAMSMWDEGGNPVLIARQSIAVFG